MDGKAGPQVATPFFQHNQFLPGRFFDPSSLPAKRCIEPADSSWTRANWQQQQQQQQQHRRQHQQHQLHQVNLSTYEGTRANWNPNSWEWDSVMCLAKPVQSCSPKSQAAPSEVLRLGLSDDTGLDPGDNGLTSQEQKRKLEEATKPLFPSKDSSEEDDADGNLALKLGASCYSYADDASSSRQTKRVRSGSPGSSYPMCQVDDCRGDLTAAKDYHRRHKVCEAHSKASKALVGNLMQRFCQQCSRFHPLPEFDEGKRSCRRRLAGHNRRRRKTQPEDALSRGLLAAAAASQDNGGLGNLNIVNLISILSRLQGNNSTVGKLSSDRDQLVQLLNKIISVSSSSEKMVGSSLGFDLNIAQGLQQSPRLDDPKANGHQSSSPTTAEAMAILSGLTGSSPEALTTILSNTLAAELVTNFKAVPSPPAPVVPTKTQENNLQTQKSNIFFGSVKTNSSPPDRVSEQALPRSLPLQLFNSSDRINPTQNGIVRKYFSSDSSNPTDERSPSSSPPLVHKLFPLHSGQEGRENDSISICRDDNLALDASPSNDGCSTYNLPNVGNRRPNQNLVSRAPFQGAESRSSAPLTGYTSSSSGSDLSPVSSNSDSQERTGRIIFKLFDRDPSNLPLQLRSQILEWLSNSPSDMESYIKPGCVMLSIFVSMPSASWDCLREDLQQRLKILVEDAGTDFWRTGRVLVQAEQQLASLKDGKLRLCRSWRSWNAPEIYHVLPIAVVAGQETILTLRGHNLAAPDTKILCAYRGKYASKDVLQGDNAPMSCSESTLTNHRVQMFTFSGGPANVFGRCFIEVDNGLKGNSFPVIVADAAICRELQSLESAFDDEFLEDKSCMLVTEHLQENSQEYSKVRAREEVINFLNELGWLFQRSSRQQAGAKFGSKPILPEFSSDRFKSIFIYAVERDWCALVKKLLDIFFEMAAGQESSYDVLLETNPLHRAVKKNCKEMVMLLLNYDISTSSFSSKYIFHPKLAGPGDLTPLHLAASLENYEALVDALTSDPQNVGLQSWNTVLDASGQTPYAYALMRNNHSYNRLVERKLSDRRNSQVSITVTNLETPKKEFAAEGIVGTLQSKTLSISSQPKLPQTCAQCASLANRKLRRVAGNQGVLYRPYMLTMLAIAAVCVCVCLLFKGPPRIGSIAPFKWENIGFGYM